MTLCQPKVSLFSLVLHVGTEMRRSQAITEVRDKHEKTIRRKRICDSEEWKQCEELEDVPFGIFCISIRNQGDRMNVQAVILCDGPI